MLGPRTVTAVGFGADLSKLADVTDAAPRYWVTSTGRVRWVWVPSPS